MDKKRLISKFGSLSAAGLLLSAQATSSVANSSPIAAQTASSRVPAAKAEVDRADSTVNEGIANENSADTVAALAPAKALEVEKLDLARATTRSRVAGRLARFGHGSHSSHSSHYSSSGGGGGSMGHVSHTSHYSSSRGGGGDAYDDTPAPAAPAPRVVPSMPSSLNSKAQPAKGKASGTPAVVAGKLTRASLAGKSDHALRLMRNGYYARHGYKFTGDSATSEDLRKYFAAKSWYHPETSDMNVIEGRMTAAEKKDVALISEIEMERAATQ